MVTFTSDAYAELSRRVAAFDEPDPYVCVIWLTAQFDLVRSPDGKAEWKEEWPGRWSVSVQALPKEEHETEGEPTFPEHYVAWVQQRLIQIGNLRVHFSPEGSGATDVTVVYSDGHFHVQHGDA